MNISRTRLAGSFVAVSAVIGLLATQSGALSTGLSAEDESPTDPARLLEGCKSGFASAGDLDIIPPANAEDVKTKNWARSPQEAAERTLGAEALFPAQSFGKLSIDAGREVIIPSGDERDSEIRATEFVVSSPDGAPIGMITIQPFEFGAYAAMSTMRCEL